ncbi:MAG TPA: hypothetical protein VIK53_17115 [Verrucomicrobiae bacterium]
MNTEKTDADQTGDTGDKGNTSARTRPPSRRIDAATIAEIAQLCAKQLTESEACRLLGINPKQWFRWKSRHKRAEKFAALLEEFRAGRIQDLIGRVEKSADGVGMKQPDWRAAAYLLSVADAKRFATSGGVSVEVTANVSPIVAQLGGEDNLKKLVSHYADAALKQLAGGQPKQLASGAVENETERVEPGA